MLMASKFLFSFLNLLKLQHENRNSDEKNSNNLSIYFVISRSKINIIYCVQIRYRRRASQAVDRIIVLKIMRAARSRQS